MSERVGFGEAGPKCPSCGRRKLRMRPLVADPTAVCLGCGEQFEGLAPKQEELVLEGERSRAAAMQHDLAVSVETVRRVTKR